MTVVDYAFSHPSISSLVTDKIRTVGRYVSESAVNDTNGKNLTPGENDALRRAGIAVVLFAEEGATDMLGGFAAGKQRAQHFDLVTKALKRTDAIMYCTADFDATPAQQTPIDAYLDGAASVIGRARTGIYGGYYPVSRALNAGKATHAAQTFAWSRFSTAGAELMSAGAVVDLAVDFEFSLETAHDQSPTVSARTDATHFSASLPSHAVLVSKVAGRTLPGTFLYDDRAGLRQGLIGSLGGGSVDFDESVMGNFGQDPAPSTPTPTTQGPTWQWYTTDGKKSLNAIVDDLNAQMPASDHIRVAQVLRMTVGKNNGQWDPPGKSIIGDWVNLALGDGANMPAREIPIPANGKLWVLRP